MKGTEGHLLSEMGSHWRMVLSRGITTVLLVLRVLLAAVLRIESRGPQGQIVRKFLQ